MLLRSIYLNNTMFWCNQSSNIFVQPNQKDSHFVRFSHYSKIHSSLNFMLCIPNGQYIYKCFMYQHPATVMPYWTTKCFDGSVLSSVSSNLVHNLGLYHQPFTILVTFYVFEYCTLCTQSCVFSFPFLRQLHILFYHTAAFYHHCDTSILCQILTDLFPRGCCIIMSRSCTNCLCWHPHSQLI